VPLLFTGASGGGYNEALPLHERKQVFEVTWFIIGSFYNATSTNWSTIHSTTLWVPMYKIL
jgi:hypothetical protein